MTTAEPQPQRLGELCAAALRALTGDAKLTWHGRMFHRGDRPLPAHAPHLRLDAETAPLPDQRAAADGMALLLRHSDAELRRRLRPEDAIERLVYELLEQLRVETLAPGEMPGMALNLRRRFEAWSLAFHHSGLTASSLGILLYTVIQVAWSRLNALPVTHETEDLIEVTRAGLAAAIGPPLAGMRRWRHDQARFAPHALDLARLVRERVRAEDEEAEGERDDATRAARRDFGLLIDFEDETEAPLPVAPSGESREFAASGRRYAVFTTRYDAVFGATGLVRRAQLREFRERLDARTAEARLSPRRIARLLAPLLTWPRRDDWTFGEEEGRIDARRLSQLVASPAQHRLFRRERHHPVAASALTLLIDCSGSMKGYAEPVALFADTLMRALDLLGVDTEVLGFTTGGWNGGRARQDWLRAGKPEHPGRLNELNHLVFKNADETWRQARPGIAALLKLNLYREGVDGEAVDWACNRLLAREAGRRILLVISDGCPMDTATGQANDDYYLDNHLKQVVARRSRAGGVEILGLGVGLVLRPYYRRAAAADFAEGIDHALFAELARVIGSGSGPGRLSLSGTCRPWHLPPDA